MNSFGFAKYAPCLYSTSYTEKKKLITKFCSGFLMCIYYFSIHTRTSSEWEKRRRVCRHRLLFFIVKIWKICTGKSAEIFFIRYQSHLILQPRNSSTFFVDFPALVRERVPWGWTYSVSAAFLDTFHDWNWLCSCYLPELHPWRNRDHNTMLELPLLPWIFHCDMAIVCNGDCSRRLCLHLLPYLSYEPGTGGLYHWLQNHHTSSFNESSKNPPEFW